MPKRAKFTPNTTTAEGDIHSEFSLYVVTKDADRDWSVKSLITNEAIEYGKNIFRSMTVSATQYTEEVIIGLEDKLWTIGQLEKEYPTPTHNTPNVGSVRIQGIRNLWKQLPKEAVFCVEYEKLASIEHKNAKTDDLIAKLDKCPGREAKRKCILDSFNAKELTHETRILIGKKREMDTKSGNYAVIDLKMLSEKKNPHTQEVQKECYRIVNVNNIRKFTWNNKLYIVE